MSVVEHSYTKAVASLTAGHLYAIGPGGDSDPVWALEDAVFVNKGTTDLRLGHSLTGILSGTNYQTVIAGTSTPLPGVLDNLLVYNPEGATPGVFSVTATGRRRNSGQDAGVLCAEGSSNSTTRFQIIRPSRTAGSTVSTTVPVKYRRTLTTINGYSVSVPSGGTLTIGLLDSRGRSLLTAVMDQEALTTLTLYTATTLVGTLGSLTIAQGDNLTLSAVSSAGGDTLGDILIELAHTVA